MELNILITVKSVTVLFILILIGWLLGKSQLISDNGQKDLTTFVLMVSMPSTIIMALQIPFNNNHLDIASKIFVIMLTFYSILIVVFFLIEKRIDNNPTNGIYETSILLGNIGFMAFPIIEKLLGNEALFYAVLGHQFLYEFVAWTFGLYFVTKNIHYGKKLTSQIKSFLSPALIATLLGIGLFFMRIKIPQPLFDTMEMLSKTTSPLAMVITGLAISKSDSGRIFKNRMTYIISFIKLLVIPIIMRVILFILDIEGYPMIICMIIVSMPTASYVVMFASKYSNNNQLASEINFICTLLSAITIPLITLLL